MRTLPAALIIALTAAACGGDDAGSPDAAIDADPHVGLWVGRAFQDGHWNEFRIELRRSGGDFLIFNTVEHLTGDKVFK